MGDRQELEQLRRLAELEGRASRVAAVRPAAPAEPPPDPTEGMKPRELLGAGIGSGAMRVFRGATNLAGDLEGMSPGGQIRQLAGGKKLTPEWASTQSIRDAAERDEPLGNTPEGFAGQIIGEGVTLAPTGGFGSSLRAATALPRAGNALARTLGRAGASAGEGALQGAITADPEERKQGVITGTAFGAAAEPVGRVLGKTLGGVVNKSPEAELLETIANQHGTEIRLPLSQGASEEGLSGMIKSIYSKVLPLIPGASAPLKRQEDKAAAAFREVALKEGAPVGTPMVPGAGKDVHTTIGTISDAFEKGYKNTVKSYAFNNPKAGDAVKYLKAKMPQIDNTTASHVSGELDKLVSRYANGGNTLSGDGLIMVKTELARLGREAKDVRTGTAFFEAQEMLDDVVRQELRVGNKPQNLKDLAEYEALSDPWKKFIRVQKAAARTKSKGGEFTAGELKNAVKKTSPDRQLARGEAPLQDLAEVGEQTVGQGARHPGFFEKGLAWTTLTSLGLLASPIGAGALYLAGKGAASKKSQEALMGELTSQRAIVKALREHPELATMVRSGARGAAIAENVDGTE